MGKKEDQLLTLRGNVSRYDAARAFKLCYGCWPRWEVASPTGLTTYGSCDTAPSYARSLPVFADDAPELTNSQLSRMVAFLSEGAGAAVMGARNELRHAGVSTVDAVGMLALADELRNLARQGSAAHREQLQPGPFPAVPTPAEALAILEDWLSICVGSAVEESLFFHTLRRLRDGLAAELGPQTDDPPSLCY